MSAYETVATLDIEIDQGADFFLPLYLADEDANGNETRKDITNYTLAAQVRRKHTDTNPLLTLACTKTDAVNGEFELSIDRTATAALTLTDPTEIAFWDFNVTDDSGKLLKRLRGRAVLVAGYTR